MNRAIFILSNMCYQSKQSKGEKALKKRFKANLKNILDPSKVISLNFNGFDFPQTPVITNLDQSSIQLFNWGLIPSWAEDQEIRKHTLNARVETLDEKPSFKEHESHRCLVLANGFYEWQWLDGKGKKKQKYEIGIENGDLFAFAGIWSKWENSSTGDVVHSYSIVTTEAQGIMRDIHNSKLRMPMILKPEDESKWLEGKPVDPFYDLRGSTENFQSSLF